MMNAIEKMEYLNTQVAGMTDELESRIIDGVIREEKETGRVGVRFDLRRFILTNMKAKGISIRKMAQRLGMMPGNLSNFFNGRIPVPVSDIEEMMWIIMDDNIRGEFDLSTVNYKKPGRPKKVKPVDEEQEG